MNQDIIVGLLVGFGLGGIGIITPAYFLGALWQKDKIKRRVMMGFPLFISIVLLVAGFWFRFK